MRRRSNLYQTGKYTKKELANKYNISWDIANNATKRHKSKT